MGTERRNRYSKEFKLNAIRMIIDEGRNATEIARDLGIHANMIYRWQKQYSEDKEESYPGNGKLKTKDEYIRKLERDNKQLRDERDILKKAAIFFAREP
jgi:transposase